MKKIYLTFLFFVGILAPIFAQYNPISKPDTYKSKDNPHYWKNRKSLTDKGYWQQDVYYRINANIDESTDIISGDEVLEYTNNSPDTLYYVYFRLSQNAFQPGSYLDQLSISNGEKIRYGKYEKIQKGTTIESIKLNGTNQEAKTELDNTILKVYLNEPLKPNSTASFQIVFKTYFDAAGSGRRRMKLFDAWGNKHYDGVHWYPRISVYDRKFGWTTDQHLGKEFYGDFGTFDVELTFSSNFIVEATGYLLNKNETLPKELREKLDIKNFKDKPWGSSPSVIVPYNPNERKTWKYHAENVHDFAFTADPTYRIGEAFYKDVQIVSLAQEGHCSGWQNAADFTAKVIEVYSKDFGEYIYNKMVVADARDGMEYPMLTLDGGRDPDYRQLLAHEVGHNWFFGMVGNNETYRAMLDEGFTQFLTSWSLEKIDGREATEIPEKNWYRKKFKEKNLVRNQRTFNAYIGSAQKDEPVFINTHSDGFNGALGHGGGYRQVYYKTSTMLYNLQYVLGDELFLKCMKAYFAKWYIAHPYIEDMRDAFIQTSKVDLNWFFDQWIETNKTIDYSVGKIKYKGKENDKYKYQVNFKRKGRMQMPIDFVAETKSGKQQGFHIPNQWFLKKTSYTVLPKWTGWDILNKNYTANILLDEKIKSIVIDTTKRLADINRLDNQSKCPIKLNFDHRIKNTVDYQNYNVFIRPDLWYNAVDGIKVGVHTEGNYSDLMHKFSLTAWYNTRTFTQEDFTKQLKGNSSELFSYNFLYNTPINKSKLVSINLKSRRLDGLELYQAGISKEILGENITVYGFFKSFRRNGTAGISYLTGNSFWIENLWNNSLNAGINIEKNRNRFYYSLNLNLRSSVYPSSYNYFEATFKENIQFKYSDFRTSFFARIGFGATPLESMLYLGGANPEAMAENKFTRSGGFVPFNWVALNTVPGNLHMGGGLNLRGYVGYLAPTELVDEKGQVSVFRTNTGSSINAEWSFAKLTRFYRQKFSKYIMLDPYLFADVGVVNYSKKGNTIDYLFTRADAGAGISLTIYKWWVLDKTEPLTIRFDSPFYLSNAPFVEAQNFKFRWLIGIEKSF
jgi:hypothetical protein